MNTKEAGKVLGVHYKTVLNMINDGRLPATKNDSGDWDISAADLAAREQRVESKEFSAVITYAAAQMVEKEHRKAMGEARNNLLAHRLSASASDPEFDEQVQRLEEALNAYKAAVAFGTTVAEIRKQAAEATGSFADETIIEWKGDTTE